MPNDLGVMRAALELESAAFIRELTKASTATSQATARMQASMAGLNKSFASAASGLKSFVAGFASVATVRAIAGIVSGVVDLGDEIGEASTKLGIGAEQLQRFRFAAAQADVGVGDLDNALKVFQQNFALGKAGVGGGSLIDGFDNLIKKIAEAPNEIEKVRIAQQALRRQFQTGLLLADQFGEAFKKSYKDAFVLSNQAVKNASDLDNQIKDLSNAVQAGFATGLLEEFNKGLALSHDDLVAINKQAEQFGHSLGGARLVSDATLVRSQVGQAFPDRGAKAYPARAAASVWSAMAEGWMTTAVMVFGVSLPQPATLGYSALTSASALACVVIAPRSLLAATPQ